MELVNCDFPKSFQQDSNIHSKTDISKLVKIEYEKNYENQ